MTTLTKTDIFLPKKTYNNFSEEEMTRYTNLIFDYYKNKGFPYYSYTTEQKEKKFNQIKKFNTDTIITKDKIIRQTMHGLGLLWSYFPHAFHIQSNNLLSPYEAFSNDELLYKIIKKRLKYGDNISDNGIRKTIKIFSGVQGVSNFRPTAAKAIYDYFLTSPNSIVYDSSAGFGGRLLGAILSDKVNTYIGTDPSTLTYAGLLHLKKDFKNKKIYIYNEGSETFLPECEVDMCFTSPPYFNTEKYSDEETQSYIKFKTKESWLNGFLKQTLINYKTILKDTGIIILNIANVKTYPALETDCLKVANEIGLIHQDTFKYALSSINSTGFKYEPVFIFKKKR